MDKEDKLPTPTVVVEAQPWPKGHIAKIISVRKRYFFVVETEHAPSCDIKCNIL